MVKNDLVPTTLRHDGEIAISVGKSRLETNWKNRTLLYSDLVRKLSQTTRTPETYNEYKKLSKKDQGSIKDVGGFVGGPLKGNRRKGDAVSWRHLITLDIDYPKGDIWSIVESVIGHACVMYSTHAHCPDNPRLRLVIPVSRSVTPDEYPAVARSIAGDIGIDFFDDTTYQPHRLMYWPSTSADGEYLFKVLDAEWLNPDTVLAKYPDWTDSNYWPESSRMKETRQKLAEKQGNPLSKPGVIGAFCRTYTVTDAIDVFLASVYASAGDGRYTYTEGSTSGGLVIYDGDTFCYSHHGTDPISGLLVNAFDLVRIHKFGHLDDEAKANTPTVKLPSYSAMAELAVTDGEVLQTMGEEQLAEAMADFNAISDGKGWFKKLKRNKQAKIESTAPNVILLLENDFNIAGRMVTDEFSRRITIIGDLPWRKLDRKLGVFWGDADDSGLRNYLSRAYGVKGKDIITDALREVLLKNTFHPIKDYLNGLNWDGLSRLDTIFIDYLGAEDNVYTRAVTRKTLVAAVARIMEPGTKFDYMPVLVGAQGVGKSYLINRLGQKWYSDSVYTVSGKEAYEAVQGSWIIEMAELAATKKSEVEAVKHFISKQEDRFRVSYDKWTSFFPRQCVFIGTTNNPVFLRDQTGNRRFWPIAVNKDNVKKSIWADLTQSEVDQIWAEAYAAWLIGETLHLDKEITDIALSIQAEYTEESEKAGLVREYLNLLLPDDWDKRDLSDRRNFIHNTDFGEQIQGTILRGRVCVMEIWAELFEGDPKHLNQMTAREINDILQNTDGWIRYTKGCKKLRFGSIYGLQRCFIRCNQDTI